MLAPLQLNSSGGITLLQLTVSAGPSWKLNFCRYPATINQYKSALCFLSPWCPQDPAGGGGGAAITHPLKDNNAVRIGAPFLRERCQQAEGGSSTFTPPICNEAVKEVSKEILKYIEPNAGENTTYQNIWYIGKAVLRNIQH